MQAEYTLLLQRLEAAEQRAHRAQRRLQLLGTLAVTSAAAFIFCNSLPRAHADITPSLLPDILRRLNIMESKTAHITSTDRDVTISGANVHIVDGTGTTASSSSLGNLIVGYNGTRGFGSDLRTGSHNIVLGDRQNFSGYGGLVAGYSNSIGKPYATVTGGFNNAASGISSSISGGSNNTTYGDASAVSGGGNSVALGSTSLMPFQTLATTVAGFSGQIANVQTNVTSFGTQITNFQTTLASYASQFASLNSDLAQETAARQAGDTALQNQMAALTASLAQEVSDRTAADTNLQTQLTAMSASLTSLLAKTQYITVDATSKSMFITGANLFVQSGSGATDDFGDLTGLGNLIVGYNETGNINGDFRTGSHNLILGQNNSYSSYGGFVAGQDNSISGRFAVVSGGQKGIASGDRSSVSGGYNNHATVDLASITGGINNIANGFYSSVVGGCANISSGLYSTVSGGVNNHANNQFSSVSGGDTNSADGISASILGGNNITVPTQFGHFP